MSVESAIDEWGPAVIARIASLRQKLNVEDEGHKGILAVLVSLEETYLKDGYQEVLHSCIPSSPVIMCHNDA